MYKKVDIVTLSDDIDFFDVANFIGMKHIFEGLTETIHQFHLYTFRRIF